MKNDLDPSVILKLEQYIFAYVCACEVLSFPSSSNVTGQRNTYIE